MEIGEQVVCFLLAIDTFEEMGVRRISSGDLGQLAI